LKGFTQWIGLFAQWIEIEFFGKWGKIGRKIGRNIFKDKISMAAKTPLITSKKWFFIYF
jgi:hypothetical protein